MSKPKPARARSARPSARRRVLAEALEGRRMLTVATPQSLGVFVPGSIARHAVVDGTSYFIGQRSASDPWALWRTDGTPAGTRAVPVQTAFQGITIGSMTAVGDALYFTAFDASNDLTLYRSDGTSAGTVAVKSFAGGDVSNLVALNGSLYFEGITANDPYGRELWRSDGTTAGTQRVADLSPGSANTSTLSMYAWNGRLYFGADVVAGGVHSGIELYVSDGTAAGTRLLKDIYPGESNGYPVDFTPFNGKLYFSAQDAAHGDELWETDGTTAGTRLAGDFVAGSAGSYVTPKAVFNGSLYVFTQPTNGTAQMWRVGAADDLTLVKQFANKASSPYASGATSFVLPLGQRLFFAAADDVHSIEPWASDGTAAGTAQLKDIMPGGGTAGTGIDDVTGAAANGIALFDANDPTHGHELCQSDGTAAGTTLVADLAPGIADSTPTDFYALGDSIVFQADPSQTFGVAQLYAATIAPPAPTKVGFDNYAAVTEGSSTTLYGYASPLAAGQTIAKWEYDFDYDGTTFDVDATGQRPTFVAPDGPATRTIALRVTDNFGQVAIAAQSLRITNADPTATFGGTVVGNTVTATFANATDPSAADRAAGLKFSFDFNDDGDFTDPGEVADAASPTATYTFASVGNHTIDGLITDKDGGLNYYTATVRTAAPPPPAGVSFDVNPLKEGGPQAFLVGHAATVAGQTIAKYEWDFDYVNNTFTADVAVGGSVNAANTTFYNYASIDGPASPTLALRVTDNYGQTTTVAQVVPIANVAPTATLASSANGLVATATFANATDPSAADRAAGFRYSFDFNNDGDFTDAGDVSNSTSASASFAFARAGTYTIRGRVADKDGGFTDYATNVAINTTRPAPPTNVGFAPLVVAEGHVQLLGGLASVATGQTITKWEYDFDYDGKTFDVDATGQQTTFDASNIDGPTTRLIAVRVTDNYGQVAVGTQSLTIVNLAPGATFGVVAGSVGGTAVATFTKAGDDGAADRAAGFRYSFDFNNDGDFTDAGEVDRGTSPTATATYAAAGTYTVGARIYDKDGDYTKYVANVLVAAPPVRPASPTNVFFSASGTMNEGTSQKFYGYATVAAGQSIARWEYDFDYDGKTFAADATGQNVAFFADDNGVGARNIALRVTDNLGQQSIVRQQVMIYDVAPTATFAVTGGAGTATATFSNVVDPSAADRAAGFSYSVDFNNDGDFLDPGEVNHGTSPTIKGTFATAGTYAVVGIVWDKDGGATTYRTSVTVTAPTTTGTSPTQLTGTPIGTPGSIGGNTVAKAFDGSLATYVDLPVQSGAWAGLDLGSARTIASVKFAPRATLARRMTGGAFQASNSATFASGVVTLGTIATPPAEGVLTTMAFAASSATYRYVRYLAPAGSFGNVAELQFFGTAGGTVTPPVTPPVVPPVTPPTTPTKLTGTAFGTAGSIGGNGFANALDGSLSTYVDSTTAGGATVGLDLGSAKVVKQIRFAPRATLGRRMVGGYFQGSNVADFSVAATLFTITTAPVDGILTSVNLANTTAYRYVRYVAPAGSFGNVAEVQFYG